MGLVLGPALFLACLSLPSDSLTDVQRRVAAVTALTAVWWIMAVLPIGATSLIPAALFPLMGVLGARDVAPMYLQDLVFLFLGAFVVALGLERWNVHKRFALWTISKLGTKPPNLVLGFMVASAFLSFWINNTSTVLLMLPIGVAVIRSVGGEKNRKGYDPFAVSLLLGMAYSASVGGIGTPVGTTPNHVFLGELSSTYPEAPNISFGQWMAAWVPLVVLYIPVGWLLLTRVVIRVPRESPRSVDTIAKERAALGPMGRGEKLMTAVFVTTAVLWVTRGGLDLGFVSLPGWAGLIAPADVAAPSKFITDATVATTMAVLCFLIPVYPRRGVYLMNWKTASRMPWEVLLLIGGGFAIAGAFKASGLDKELGAMLAPLIEGRSDWIIVGAVVVFMAALTEITSNTATTMVLLPVLGKTAAEAGLDPLLMMAPATIAASAAFMLPVATPPNAVVFSSRLVSVGRMARVGFWFNIAMAILIILVFQLWARGVLGIGKGMPDWAGGWPALKARASIPDTGNRGAAGPIPEARTTNMMRRTIPVGAALALALALAAAGQERVSPLENGDVLGLAVTSPPGTRIEYFRLDLPAPPAAAPTDKGGEAHDPVGVVRWISGPDVEDGVPVGMRLEIAATFFDVDTRVIHTEHLRPDERKLVYREIRERGGRTILLEWSPDAGPRSVEVVAGEARRRDIDAARGVLLPLYLVEHVRSGASIEGPFAVFSPLAGDVETLEVELRAADGGANDHSGRRELRLRRAGDLPAGRYVLEGERLVRFQWQEGGPIAEPITAEAYHGWIRRHRTDRGH